MRRLGHELARNNQAMKDELKKLCQKDKDREQQLADLKQKEVQAKQDMAALENAKKQAEKKASDEAKRADREKDHTDDAETMVVEEQHRANKAVHDLAEVQTVEGYGDSDAVLKRFLAALGTSMEQVGRTVSNNLTESAAKKPWLEESKSEFFHLDGMAKIVANYEGMLMEGITAHHEVHPSIANKIMRDEYFDLNKMIDPDGPSKGIQTKPEFFENLYRFALFYLHKYPQKAVGFISYLLYMSQQSAMLNLAGLLKLDSDLRVQYVENPDWNWTQDHYTTFQAAANMKERPEFRTACFALGQPLGQGQGKLPKQGKLHGYQKSLHRQPHLQLQQHQLQPHRGRKLSQEEVEKLKTQRCSNWNSDKCTRSVCFKQHVCWYCRNNHKKGNCPNPPPPPRQ